MARILGSGFFRRQAAPATPPRTSSRDFTQLLASALQHVWWGGRGLDAVPSLAGAVRVAEGAWSRALTAAVVTGDDPAAAALRDILPAAGAAYVRSGEFAARVHFDGGRRPRMAPLAIIARAGPAPPPPRGKPGKAPPAAPGPAGRGPAGELLHVVWHPAAGTGALRGEPPWSGHLSRALANLEDSIGSEARLPVGQSMRVHSPAELDDTAVTEFYGDLEESLDDASISGFFPYLLQGAGKIAGDGGTGTILHRYGPEHPDAVPQIETVLLGAVLGACGVPPIMLSQNLGAGAWRDAWRSFLASAVTPVAGRLARQAGELLGATIEVRVAPANRTPADNVSSARAVGSLVSAGVELERALRIAGLDEA